MGFAICTFYDQFHESVSRFSQNFHLRPNQTVYLDLRLKGKQNEIYFFILNSSSRTNNFLSCSLVCSFGIFCVFSHSFMADPSWPGWSFPLFCFETWSLVVLLHFWRLWFYLMHFSFTRKLLKMEHTVTTANLLATSTCPSP